MSLVMGPLSVKDIASSNFTALHVWRQEYTVTNADTAVSSGDQAFFMIGPLETLTERKSKKTLKRIRAILMDCILAKR